jgi:subtilisin
LVRDLSKDKRAKEKVVLLFSITVLCLFGSVATTTVARSIDVLAYQVEMDNDSGSHYNSYSSLSSINQHKLNRILQSLQMTSAPEEPISANSSYKYYANNNNDRYIIGLREGSSPDDRLALIDEIKRSSGLHSLRIPHVINEFNSVFLGFSISIPGSDNANILQTIQNNPHVAFAERDQRVHVFAQTLPTGINRVDGDLSATKSGNGEGTVDTDIAILDTGVDLDHPDLNVYRERTFVSGTTSADDDDGHGTHVAGVAAAKDNNIGVVGIAPGARIWAVKVLDNTGSGFISDIIAGIDYLNQNAEEVDIANMSFGCECTSSALDTAIDNSVSKGITFVAAAGNSGKDASTFSPANNVNVIAVSAIVDTDGKCGGNGQSTSAGNDDSFASFSNFGSTVDIAAPGVIIYSTNIGGSYSTMSGTSMASPHVAGAAGLFKSIDNSASPSVIKDGLTSTGSKPNTVCDGNGHGYFTGDPDQSHEPLLYIEHQSGSLKYLSATQTSNLVSIKSYYDIMLRTSTSGTVKTIDIDFPPGTYVGAALLVEAVGIGPGKIAASGSTATGPTITYTVDNAVNIPAGTNLRIQISNIGNPQDPASSYVVIVTTRDAASTTIDGPTQSREYLIKQRE